MGWKPAGPWAPAWPWELPGSFQHRTLHRGRWAARLVLESGQVLSFHSTLSPSLGTSWTLERWDSVSPGLQVASPAGRRLRPGAVSSSEMGVAFPSVVVSRALLSFSDLRFEFLTALTFVVLVIR